VTTELGLFPLGIVLLPTEQVPLHIFEERYKELIAECLADEEEFGLVYADSDGVREIGTRAAVIEVLARLEDGRMNVVVEGRERFRLLELTEGRNFHTGAVEPFVDEEDPAHPEAATRALELFERLRELTGSEVEVPAADSPQLSYELAARVELAPEAKQALLQEVSERVRVERVGELLAEASLTVERQRRAGERAATNGKVDLA
jgi:Lon protease-like protein